MLSLGFGFWVSSLVLGFGPRVLGFGLGFLGLGSLGLGFTSLKWSAFVVSMWCSFQVLIAFI